MINKQNPDTNTYISNKANLRQKSNKHPAYIMAILIVLLITSAFLSIMLGSVHLNPVDILQCFTGRDRSSVTYILIMNIRIPRMVGAIVAGMGLSIAGVILQSVMNNALASPNTIGVYILAALDTKFSVFAFLSVAVSTNYRILFTVELL